VIQVMQLGITHFVTCDKVIEFDYVCSSWHHWSPLTTQSLIQLWGNQQCH